MDEPPEEGELKSTASPPTTGHPNNQEEDIQKNQAQGGVNDQTNDRIAGQADHQVHIGPGADDQVNQRSSEQTGDKASSQADNTAYGLMDQSAPTDQRATQQPEEELSKPIEQRPSQQVDHTLSSHEEKRAAQQADQRLSGQAERKLSQQPDFRLSRQADGEIAEGLSYQADYRTQPHSYNQDTEVVEQQSADETDSEANQLTVDQDYYSEDDQVDYTDDYPSSNETPGQFEDRKFPVFNDKDREDGYRIQYYNLEDSSTETKDQGSNPTQVDGQAGVRFTNTCQAKGQSSYQKLPSISSRVHTTANQEKAQYTESSPVGERGI
jgi:hypothetical protein